MSAANVDLGYFIPVLPGNWKEVPSPTLGARAFISTKELHVIASIDQAQDGSFWYHVSLSRQHRLPSYEDMSAVKDLFIGLEREALQVFPPHSRYVNDHPTCLHLWHQIGEPVMPDMRKYEPGLGRLSI